jgi:hypothetical protein
MFDRPARDLPPGALAKLMLEGRVAELCKVEMGGAAGNEDIRFARRSLNAIFVGRWEDVVAKSLLSQSLYIRMKEFERNQPGNDLAAKVMDSAAEIYFVGLVAETLQLFLGEGKKYPAFRLGSDTPPPDREERWQSLPLKRGRTTLGEVTILMDLSRARHQEERKRREELLRKGRHSYLIAARSEVSGEILEGEGWSGALSYRPLKELARDSIMGGIEICVPVEPVFEKIRLLLSLTR